MKPCVMKMMKMTISSNDYSILADRIVLFHNAVKDSKLLTDIADKSDWVPNTHDGYPDGITRRFEASISVSRRVPTEEAVLDDLSNVLTEYASIIGSTEDESSHDLGDTWHGHISKYIPGGRTGVHSDENYTEDNGVYSVILYLNDDYDDGEVVFVDYDVTIKPSIGDVLIFPSYYLHYSSPVLSGNKYMSVFRLRY